MCSSNRLIIFVICFVLGSCASQQRVMPDPDFAPVFPELSGTKKPVTGSLYNDGTGIVGGISDSWFGRRKNFKVGDIVVVVLDERAQASRTQNTTVERETENDVAHATSFRVSLLGPSGYAAACCATQAPRMGVGGRRHRTVAGRAAGLFAFWS